MKFQPGNKAGGGRKKGSKNKAGKTLRDTITLFLEDQFDEIRACFETLPPKDRAKLYIELLTFGLPKLQASTLDVSFDNLNDDQLNEIFQKLIQHNEKQLQHSSN